MRKTVGMDDETKAAVVEAVMGAPKKGPRMHYGHKRWQERQDGRYDVYLYPHCVGIHQGDAGPKMLERVTPHMELVTCKNCHITMHLQYAMDKHLPPPGICTRQELDAGGQAARADPEVRALLEREWEGIETDA